MTRVNEMAVRRPGGGERVEEIDYRTRRKNRTLRIGRCPKCGLNGKRIDLTMSRGPDRCRVRVWFQHLVRFVDLGVCRSHQDGGVDCFMWQDEYPQELV